MDMRDLPSGMSPDSKRYVGYFDGPRLAAVLDIVGGYPGERVAFIGLFMVDGAYQGRGVGTGIVGELCAYLEGAGYAAARLCRVVTNPQSERFWRKNGFLDTGTLIPMSRYTVAVAQRRLIPPPEVRLADDGDAGALARLAAEVRPELCGAETPEARGRTLCVPDGRESQRSVLSAASGLAAALAIISLSTLKSL